MISQTSIMDIQISGLSLVECIEMLLIIVAFALTIFKTDSSNKKIFWSYMLLLGVYVVFHLFNIYQFNLDVYPFMDKNYLKEVYYIVRVYLIPILLITTLMYNPVVFNRKYFLSILKYYIIIISGSIVFCNLIGFSISTYDLSHDWLINRTHFFDVFTYEGEAVDLLTCGLFPSANQIAIILVILLPMNIYNYYKNDSVFNKFLVILQVISMIIVGTKVAALGSLLILTGLFVVYILFIGLKKVKVNLSFLKNYIFIFLFALVFLLISPFIIKFRDDYNFKYDKTEAVIKEAYNVLEQDLSIDDFERIMIENNGIYRISSMFYELYPIRLDPSFWLNIAKRNASLNNDYRIIKQDIINRIVDRNNNPADKIFGVGYVLNFMDLEVDYVYQYHLFGIFGLFLLVLQYPILYIIKSIQFVSNKKTFKYGNVVLILSPFIGMVCCYFSGHLFGWGAPMTILAFSIAFMCNKDVRLYG